MERDKLIRDLRIAWSLVCGILCLLLVLLWVRSKFWQDLFTRVAPTDQQFHSVAIEDGLLCIIYVPNIYPETRWESYSVQLSERRGRFVTRSPFGFSFTREYNPWKETTITTVVAPFWFLTLFAAGIALLPWLRWNYSLRTLLIATTVVAAILGLAVYATR